PRRRRSRACAPRSTSSPPTIRMRAVDAVARAARYRRIRAGACVAAAALLIQSRSAFAQDEANAWLQRAADAARSLNYAGTLVYQHSGRVETSRVLHLADASGEHEKLVNLDGPPREVVRNNEQIRCYYPDAKIIRLEQRNSRNAFPSLLPQQQATLV